MSQNQTFACDLTAINKDEREKHKKASQKVFGSVQDFRELDDGYAFRLPAETDVVEKAGSFMSRERLCCPFFNFGLEVAPDHGPVWLKLKGDERVKEFIAENIIVQLKDGNTSDWSQANETTG